MSRESRTLGVLAEVAAFLLAVMQVIPLVAAQQVTGQLG
jgi:hypothetical protein